jgi:ubiquinone/menaquinone biosynthesis C-methylase UbiE
MRSDPLKRLARDWNRLGRRNAFGAILTGGSGAIQAWNTDAFFATGGLDVGRFMTNLSDLAAGSKRGRALDFGCGVGRITRALAAHFDSVTGVDVSPSMIEQARALNADMPRCEFLVNSEPHLAMFPSARFDVVYCRLVLQHIPAPLQPGYIEELIRVLAPGGVLMFQLPERIKSPLARYLVAPVAAGTLKQHLPLAVIRTYRLLTYLYVIARPGPRMEMRGLPFGQVSALIAQSGARLLAAIPDESHGLASVRGFEYWVTRNS